MKNVFPKRDVAKNELGHLKELKEQELNLDLPVLKEVNNNSNNNNKYFNKEFMIKLNEERDKRLNSINSSQFSPSFTNPLIIKNPFQVSQEPINKNPFQSSQVPMAKKEVPKIVLTEEQEAEIFLGKLKGRVLGDKNRHPLMELVEDLGISFEVEDFIKMKNLKMNFEDYCIMKGISSGIKKNRVVKCNPIYSKINFKNDELEEEEEYDEEYDEEEEEEEEQEKRFEKPKKRIEEDDYEDFDSISSPVTSNIKISSSNEIKNRMFNNKIENKSSFG
jgi:hypothetical protein